MNNIEILENKIQCFRHMQNTLNDDEKELFEDGIQQEEIQAIENLIKENKELKEGLKYRINYCKLLEKELYANGINYEFEKTEIEKRYLED
jgi:polyhydroxyalkanoate synthesis regulator protein